MRTNALSSKQPEFCAAYFKLLLLISLITATGCNNGDPTGQTTESPTNSTSAIRLGWQIPWATQGQVVQSLKHTNIADDNDLKIEFKGFSYGGPLNEAALAGVVDAIFTADQPAAMLLANGGEWTIVGRLMYNRVAIYVPPKSKIKTVKDLKGKKVAMPYGAAAQRVALEVIQNAGLDPAKDIKSLNLDIYEQNAIVQAGSKESWGQIDALVGFDPTPAIFEHNDQARMLHVGQVVSLVLISDEYLANNPNGCKRFLKSFVEGWHYYAANQKTANEWFRSESRLSFDSAVLDIAASVEPNINAQSVLDIRPTLNENDREVIQSAATFIFKQKLAKKEVKMDEHIDQSIMLTVLDELKSAEARQP